MFSPGSNRVLVIIPSIHLCGVEKQTVRDITIFGNDGANLCDCKATLGKCPERPFYTSVGGNKSNVLPNGIFDVILEAEQTGGVIRKRNERSRR